VCALVALALAGCRESSGPRQPKQYGYAIFNANIDNGVSGGVTPSPVGFFFRAPALQLPSSESGADNCVVQQIVNQPSQLPEFISAGDSVGFAAEGSPTVFLKPATDSGVPRYRVSDRTPVALTAGANVTFTVPGAADGFPASTITLKTVAPYTMSTVPADLPPNTAVTLSWTPAGSDDSKMDVSFAYATTPNGVLSEQLYCSLLDDGEFIVPASFLVGYRSAANDVRQFSSRRWRTSFKDLNGSVMLALSGYSAPNQPALALAP
jgi:hypothetical protein